jgi:hypothetical protein
MDYPGPTRGAGQLTGSHPHGTPDPKGNYMGILDDAKKLIDQHDDKVDQAAEKLGDLIDGKTGGKYTDKIDGAVHTVQEKTGEGDTTAR